MKRSILILCAFISFVAASLAFISADEPAYKNLKILPKHITRQQLDSVMHFFSMSLGERCNFCHVRNDAEKTMDFASDANPNKGTARFMMRMTTKINKKYFKVNDKEQDGDNGTILAVTCYTCHHGLGHPETKPGKMNGNKMGEMPRNGMGMPPHDMKSPDDSMKKMSADSMK